MSLMARLHSLLIPHGKLSPPSFFGNFLYLLQVIYISLASLASSCLSQLLFNCYFLRNSSFRKCKMRRNGIIKNITLGTKIKMISMWRSLAAERASVECMMFYEQRQPRW